MPLTIGTRILCVSAMVVILTAAGFITYFDFNQRSEIRDQFITKVRAG